MDRPVIVLVSIFVRPGELPTLRAYELQARAVMLRHGGDFERVLRAQGPRQASGAPDEVHLLRFPSRDAFDAFRADPALGPHIPLRERAIERAVVTFLGDVPLDEYFDSP